MTATFNSPVEANKGLDYKIPDSRSLPSLLDHYPLQFC